MVGNAKDKSELIDKQCTKIETDLELVGASAIEDKLQNNVP